MTTGISLPLKLLGYTHEEFAQHIKKWRIDAGFSQEMMRDYIGGITVDCYRMWEQGRRVPRSRVIINKMVILGIL